MYAAKTVADSVSPKGKRITTMEVIFPRFILAEVNTHCRLSRNSASSRAIPTERQIKMVMDHPFVPRFNKRVKGMGTGEFLTGDEAAFMETEWREACKDALHHAEEMAEGADKSRVNRLLEPFMWHTAVITATEWENFNALRIPPGEEVDLDFPAQQEFQILGLHMRRAIRASEPQHLAYGDWHLPYVTEELTEHAYEGLYLPKVSAARCARVSYLRQGDDKPADEDYAFAVDRLLASGHMSPFQHPASPQRIPSLKSGNYEGWSQLRKLLPNEANPQGFNREPFDPRSPHGVWLETEHG